MQNHENIDKIKKLKRELKEELFKLQNQQYRTLKQFCLNNGGHYFYEYIRFDPDLMVKYKLCEACGYREDII